MILALINVVCVLISLTSNVSSAGVLCHNEVLRRAQHTYSLPRSPAEQSDRLPIAAWLKEYASFAQAGASFPDWGYGCLASDEEAEASHWPPFLAASVDYLLDTYPDVRASTKGQQLLSFIFGFAAHQNTDATWHSIKMVNGLLSAMADVDFASDYGSAHSVLDTGGDAILAKEYALQEDTDGFAYLKTKWSVPVQDIINIYGRMGYRISALKLRYCMTRGFAGLSALRSLGATLAPRYQVQSPFMNTELERHFLGSIEEASTTTVMCWLALETWLTAGAPSSDASWQICDPMAIIYKRGKAGPYGGRDARFDKNSTLDSGRCRADLHQEALAAELSLVDSIEDEKSGILTIVAIDDHSKRTISKSNHAHSEPQAADFLTPSIAYSEFGTSLAMLEVEGTQNLAIGSPKDTDWSSQPSQGSTYVVVLQDQISSTGVQVGDWLDLPSTILRSQQTVTDAMLFQKDPAVLNQETKLQLEPDNLYFGKLLANLTISGKVYLAISSSRKVELFRARNGTTDILPYITIINRRHRPFSSPPLASSIYTFKHNGIHVLALTTPWDYRQAAGAVYLFAETTLTRGLIFMDNADLVLRLQDVHKNDRLGSAITYSSKHRTLMVGLASRRQIIGFSLNGQLTKYVESFRLNDPSPQVLHTGFGSSGLLARGNLLYVGSSTEDYADVSQAGLVRVYHLAPLYKKNSKRKNAPWTIKSIQEIVPQEPFAFSQFGSKITSARPVGDGIYISAINYQDRGAIFYAPSPIVRRGKRQPREGLVQFMMSRISGKSTTQSSIASRVIIAPCVVGYETNGKFGTDIVVGSHGVVAIGAPNARGLSSRDRRAGKTFIYTNLCI